MRTRFIKPGKRNRMLIRGPFTDDTITVSKYLLGSGYQAATFIQFWLHVVFWKREKARLQRIEARKNMYPTLEDDGTPSSEGGRKTEAKGEAK